MTRHTSAAREYAVDIAVDRVPILHRGSSSRSAFGVRMARIVALLRGIGPYAAIELILPGGSVIALFLWLCRHDATVSSVTCAARAVIARTLERQLAAFTQLRAVCRAG